MSNFDLVMPIAFFTLIAGLLSYLDIKTHRLPNPLVIITTFGVFGIAGFTKFDSTIGYATLISVGYLAIFSALKAIGKNSIGMGDVKFSISCGLIIGIYAPSYWLLNIWLMFAIAAMIILVRSIFNKMSWHDRLAFGPYMAASTILVSLNSLRTMFA